MYRSVAVPLDGAPDAESAVELAASIAFRSHALLHLLMMARPGAGVGLGRSRAAVRSRYLDEVTARVKARTGIRVHGQVLRGDAGVAERLAAHVRGHVVDLVVTAPDVGGHAREPIATRLCDRIPAPLLVVPKGGLDDDRARTILVPLDGATPAERVLPFVGSLAEIVDGRVTLLTVLAPSYVIGASRSRGAAVDCRVDLKRRAAQAYLDDVAQTLRRRGRDDVATRVLVRARPAPAIADFALSEGVGLLAMSGWSREKRGFMVGEILRLLEDAPVATLTYYPPEWRVSRRLRPSEG